MLKVGFSRLDVTPPLGNDLSGYFVRRIADGILDPLYLNTVAISNDKETVILIAVDYIGMQVGVCDDLREMISERTGVPTDHIMVAALHQHTAPCLTGELKRHGTELKDKNFIDVVMRKFADGAQMAMDDRKEAVMSTATGEVAEPISFVRRYFVSDGNVKSNPNTDKYAVVKRCSESDNSVRLVRFKREGANDVAIINFSTHPDVISGEKWSADWPGFTRRFVEEDIGNVSSIFFTGTQGDSNHVDFFKPKAERRAGYKHSEYMGRMVADAVISIWDKTTESVGDKIASYTDTIYNPTNIEGLEYYDDAVEYDRLYTEQSTGANWSSISIKHDYITCIAHAKRIMRLRTSPIFQSFPMMFITVGDFAMVGFGGEAFTSYSTVLKGVLKDKFLMTAVCANGYEGYFPTAEAFKQGGYEVIGSLYTPQLEDQIIGSVSDMYKKSMDENNE